MGILAAVIDWEWNPWAKEGEGSSALDRTLDAMSTAVRPRQGDPWSVARDAARIESDAVQGSPSVAAAGAVAGNGSQIVSTGSVLLAFDGRLDRDTLRDELGCHEGILNARTLMRVLRDRGTGFLSRMRGDWAFVIADLGARQVIAARSPLGNRPLYYARTRGCLLFATQIEQILAVPGVERVLDEQHVIEYLTWELESAQLTPFRRVLRLVPGHYLEASATRREPAQTRYWLPPAPSREWVSDRECGDGFLAAFERSVGERLASDSPILAQLSGGLDSASIVCVADQIYRARTREGFMTSPPLHVASAVYPGMDCDESEFIKMVAERVQFPAHTWDGTSAAPIVAGDLASPWPLWPSGYVAGDIEIARRLGAEVILSGHGGDEIGFEVGVFRDLARAGRWWTLLRETVFAPRSFDEPSSSYLSRPNRMRYFQDAWKGLLPSALMRAARSIQRHRHSRAIPAWFGPRLRSVAAARARMPVPATMMNGAFLQAAVWNALTSASMCYGVDACQDRAAKSGLEIRFPFLDARLAELVLSIPWEHRLPHGLMRRLQREALSRVLPPRVAQRRTVTYFRSAQITQIACSFSQAREILWDRTWISAPLVSQTEARAMFQALERPSTRAKSGETAYRLRDIVLLELWLREHGIQIRS